MLCSADRPGEASHQVCPVLRRPSGLPKATVKKESIPTYTAELTSDSSWMYLVHEESSCVRKNTQVKMTTVHLTSVFCYLELGHHRQKYFPTLWASITWQSTNGVERCKQDPERAFTCLREEGALGGRGCEDTVFRSPFCSRKDYRETRETIDRYRLPWWSSGKDSALPTTAWGWGGGVLSLLGVLRSHVLCGTTKTKMKKVRTYCPCRRVLKSAH